MLDTEASTPSGTDGPLRRRRLRGRRDEPQGPRGCGDRHGRPRHRVHVARRGESRRRHVRATRGRARDDRDPHVEHRVRRPLARGPARRRLRRLVRARDGARDQPHPRCPGSPADGRLRRRPGAARRVRRRRGRVQRTSLGVPLRDAADPGRLEGRGDHPRRRDDPSRAATTRSQTGDRIVVIGSPRAVKAWSTLLWPEGGAVRDVVIFGAGRVGSAIARVLLSRG